MVEVQQQGGIIGSFFKYMLIIVLVALLFLLPFIVTGQTGYDFMMLLWVGIGEVIFVGVLYSINTAYKRKTGYGILPFDGKKRRQKIGSVKKSSKKKKRSKNTTKKTNN